jgi:two-component system, chemotaxis family, CheB/CheR fusion protein
MRSVHMLSTSGPLHGCSIMVVDDDIDTLEFLSLVLRRLGAGVDVAANGDIARAVVETSRPDVMLCDLGLPGMDGYALLGKLEECGATYPVIAISGFHSPSQHDRALAAGFAAYLPKPSRLAVIVATIMDVLDDEQTSLFQRS